MEKDIAPACSSLQKLTSLQGGYAEVPSNA